MANTTIQPYLFFGGRCEEALEFYKTALGAKVEFLMRFSESPVPHLPGQVPPGFENKVMHSTFHIGDNTLMASDGCDPATKFFAFSLAMSVSTDAEADRVFAALAEGGQVQMPLSPTFWAKRFGMVQDRFGVGWMITVKP